MNLLTYVFIFTRTGHTNVRMGPLLPLYQVRIILSSFEYVKNLQSIRLHVVNFFSYSFVSHINKKWTNAQSNQSIISRTIYSVYRQYVLCAVLLMRIQQQNIRNLVIYGKSNGSFICQSLNIRDAHIHTYYTHPK